MKVKLTNLLFPLILIVLTQCKSKEDKLKHLYGQQNAVWTESIYLRGYKPSTGEKISNEHIKEYAETLKNNKVKYAYLFAGPYGEDGHLPEYAFSEIAINSVKILKGYYPEIVILPWVGGVQNKTVYLNDSLWVNNALVDTKKLLYTLNVPGVHVDLEFILPGDSLLDTEINKAKPGDLEAYADNVNSFHKKLRQIIPEAFISSVVVAPSTDTRPWKRKTSMSELNELVKYIDQLSFLYYDTQINDQKMFEDNCAELIRDVRMLKSSRDIQYLVAIGTFVNRSELHKYRNLEIENIPNSLQTIKSKASLIDSTKQLVNGIALFCDWETDEQEWGEFYENWVK